MFEELDDFDDARLASMTETFMRYAREAIAAEEYVGWIAELGSTPIGTAGLVFQTLPPHPLNLDRPFGHVLNVFVEPAHRRRGVATRLVETAVAFCRDRGLASVVLHASEAGAKVYERLGFSHTDQMRLWL
jgi:GNAT superfamily N-acetyltransferase